jgi:hypothetical protein
MSAASSTGLASNPVRRALDTERTRTGSWARCWDRVVAVDAFADAELLG